MKYITERREKKNKTTVIARFKEKADEKRFRKDIQKVIRKWDHILDAGMSLELITISAEHDNH